MSATGQRIINAATTEVADRHLTHTGYAAALGAAGAADRDTVAALLAGERRTRQLPAKVAAAAVRRLGARNETERIKAITVGERRRTVLHPKPAFAAARNPAWPGQTTQALVRRRPTRSPGYILLTAAGERERGNDAVEEHLDQAWDAAGGWGTPGFWGALSVALNSERTGRPAGFTLRAQAMCAALTRSGRLEAAAPSGVDATLAAIATIRGNDDNDISVTAVTAVLGSTQYRNAPNSTRSTLYAALATAAADAGGIRWEKVRPHVGREVTVGALAALELRAAGVFEYPRAAAEVLAAHLTTTGEAPLDAARLYGTDPEELRDDQLEALWRAGQRSGIDAYELAELIIAGTADGTRGRSFTHSSYITVLEDTAGHLEIAHALAITDADNMSREPELAAAIAGWWGHRWDADTVAAAIAAQPSERRHGVYFELARHTTRSTPVVLTDEAARTVGLLRWCELVPGAAGQLYTAAAHLGAAEWTALWQLLANGFCGTATEAVTIATTIA